MAAIAPTSERSESLARRHAFIVGRQNINDEGELALTPHHRDTEKVS
jgi:hypothetical protein